MIDRVTKAVLERMRKTLDDGKAIAIVGWRASNHNLFTGSLPTKKVIFTKDMKLPQRVGFTIITRFVTHSEVERLKCQEINLHTIALTTGAIKRLLEACTDLLTSDSLLAQVSVSVVNVPKVTASSPFDTHNQILDYLTQPTKELNDMEKFVVDFLAEASKNDGRVGKTTLGKLREKHNLAETSAVLVSGKWLEGHVKVGNQKVGWYTAGSKMLAMAKQLNTEPTDPIERARHMIAQKESVIVEKATLEAQISTVNEKLKRIEQAESLLRQLETLMQ